MRGRSIKTVAGEIHHEACQSGSAFAAHGVALVGHGTGADLFGLERLLDFLEVCQQSKIVAALVDGGGGDRQAGKNLRIHQARVGLPAYWPAAIRWPAELCCKVSLQRFDLGGVATQEAQI